MRAVLLERNREIGIAVLGADAVIEQSAVRNTLPRDSDGRGGRGILAQLDTATASPVTLTMRSVLIEDSHECAVGVTGGEASIEWSRIVRTSPQQSDGLFGDGVVVQQLSLPTRAQIVASRIEASSRVGIAAFGARISVGSSRLECNGVHLNGERWDDSPFQFNDWGLNVFGCGDPLVRCQLMISNLEPPAPL